MLFQLLAKIVYSADANGDPIENQIPLPDLHPGDYGAAFAKMFITLIALILLMAGTFWFLRRLVRTRQLRGSSKMSIQVLEKRMISSKSMLYLIEVEGQKILLAESQSEIRRLQTWPRETSDASKEPFSIEA